MIAPLNEKIKRALIARFTFGRAVKAEPCSEKFVCLQLFDQLRPNGPVRQGLEISDIKQDEGLDIYVALTSYSAPLTETMHYFSRKFLLEYGII